MPLTSAIEHENQSKTRKALYFSAFFTFAAANAELLSGEMSIFGLRIAVVQADLVAFGQLITLLLFAIFILHCSVAASQAISTTIAEVNVSWNQRSLTNIQRMNDHLDLDPNYEHEDPLGGLEPWEYEHHKEHFKRLRHESIAELIVKILSRLRSFIIEYFLVLVAATYALLNPRIVNQAVQFWQSL
ncbi:hypothetical protein [Ruegeria sp.]|uniref:hypothetical protein n=1 Tax=Ruegeria sp. TaxID=1879320 RepID=UPI0023109691|nr:hypothetical protein [Ruegeria sp.]MDA7967072.1 hypothetical protein [Ruegeria sp.]